DELVVESRFEDETGRPDYDETLLLIRQAVVDAAQDGEVGFLTEAHRIYESLRVNLLMTTGDAPLLPGAADAYGGVRTSDSSGPIICTSGFTVNGPYGSGLVSAGHCVGSWSWTDRFEEFHGGSLYTMFFRDGER